MRPAAARRASSATTVLLPTPRSPLSRAWWNWRRCSPGEGVEHPLVLRLAVEGELRGGGGRARPVGQVVGGGDLGRQEERRLFGAGAVARLARVGPPGIDGAGHLLAEQRGREGDVEYGDRVQFRFGEVLEGHVQQQFQGDAVERARRPGTPRRTRQGPRAPVA